MVSSIGPPDCHIVVPKCIHGVYCSYIFGTEAISLTYSNSGLAGNNSWLVVFRKGEATVVHNGSEIISPEVITIRNVLVEVVLSAGLDVLPIDLYKTIPILPALLMPQPPGVTYFVNCAAGSTSGGQPDVLPTSLHSN